MYEYIAKHIYNIVYIPDFSYAIEHRRWWCKQFAWIYPRISIDYKLLNTSSHTKDVCQRLSLSKRIACAYTRIQSFVSFASPLTSIWVSCTSVCAERARCSARMFNEPVGMRATEQGLWRCADIRAIMNEREQSELWRAKVRIALRCDRAKVKAEGRGTASSRTHDAYIYDWHLGWTRSEWIFKYLRWTAYYLYIDTICAGTSRVLVISRFASAQVNAVIRWVR